MHCQEGAALRDIKGCQWPEPAPKQVRPGASSQAGSFKHSIQLGRYNEPCCIFTSCCVSLLALWHRSSRVTKQALLLYN